MIKNGKFLFVSRYTYNRDAFTNIKVSKAVKAIECQYLFITIRIIEYNHHLFDIFVQPKYIIKSTESSETSISSYISIPKIQTESRTKSQRSCETKVISPNIASLISSCKLVRHVLYVLKLSSLITLNQ